MGGEYDVVIVGGGVSGTALLYVLSRYTNVKRIALLEKYPELARVNSSKDNNSQTLHFGDIETNYPLEKAKQVKAAAAMTARYLERHKDERLYKKSQKMVLAVGADEVRALKRRHKEFRKLFPKTRLLDRKQIARVEPNVVKGRDPTEPLAAMYTPDGHVVDYGRLARSFATHAKQAGKHVEIILGTKVHSIQREGKKYVIRNDRTIVAKTVVVAAGADSLLFAHRLEYAKNWILLPVAGSFYCAPHLLRGKVYTMQLRKLPFAAVHGDPDVENPDETRFGPTAKVLPMTERRDWLSIIDFLRLFRFRWDATLTLLNILADRVYLRYIAKQVLYDIPFIGTYFFMRQNVRKIVPAITYAQIRYGRGLGGIRPQVADTRTRGMMMGDAKVIGDNIIFDITPSPGASVCLKNAQDNARIITGFLKARFDEERFLKEYA